MFPILVVKFYQISIKTTRRQRRVNLLPNNANINKKTLSEVIDGL